MLETLFTLMLYANAFAAGALLFLLAIGGLIVLRRRP